MKLDNMFKQKISRKKKEKLNIGRKRNRRDLKKREIREEEKVDIRKKRNRRDIKKQRNNKKQREENLVTKKCSFLFITKKKCRFSIYQGKKSVELGSI